MLRVALNGSRLTPSAELTRSSMDLTGAFASAGCTGTSVRLFSLSGKPFGPASRNALQPAVRSTTLLQRLRPLNSQHHQHQQRLQYHLARTSRRKKPEISGDAVVAGLIAVNVGVTMLWMTSTKYRMRNRMLNNFTTSAQHMDAGRYYTLLTAAFSHADVGHLLANMIGLFFFGRQICDVVGPKRFLGLYLASGVISSWAAVQEQRLSQRYAINLGASGAVNSITALSILLFPHSTLLIFGILPMPAWLAGSMFIFKDGYSWLKGQQDGIGHFAHLSGAVCGGAYYFYLRRAGLRYFR